MVTMKTVAENAGVSRATVSYVLNGRHHEKGLNINPDTVTKVEQTASKLGYRRNELARSVRTGKSNVLGFVGGLGSSYTMHIISGIATMCEKSNYLLKLLQLHAHTEMKVIAEQCIAQRLSGIICCSLKEGQLDVLHRELQPFDIPIVLVDNSFSHDWCSRVVSDDFVGAQMATEHLLKLGHRRIGNISNSFDSRFATIRNAGYRHALSEAGIEPDDKLLSIIPRSYNFTAEDDMKIKDFISEQQPTALFCSSDPIAMDTIHAINALGLKVPEDISIVGYADLPYARLATPRLTTVRQPFVGMGEKATEIIFKELAEKQEKVEIELTVELIDRESTAPVMNYEL